MFLGKQLPVVDSVKDLEGFFIVHLCGQALENWTLPLKLQLVQNFAVRLLDIDITLTLKEFKFPPVHVLESFRLRKTLFRCSSVCNQAPTYLANMFKKRSESHKYTNNNLTLPLCSISTFTYGGTVVWTSVEPVIPNSSRVDTFEHSLRNYFLASFLSNEVP